MSNTEDFFKAEFPFIADNLFLVACVNKKSGKQKLKIQKIEPLSKRIEFEDGIDCIHTAITTITYDEFSKIHENEESAEKFAKNMINARSTEQLVTVDLSPEERFFAFKSWTQGIAEAGLDALNLQTNIETAAKFQYPIANFLLKSLTNIGFDFIGTFLENVKKTCRFEGIYHKPSLRANINLILEIISSYLADSTKSDMITDLLIEIAELDSEFLFKESNYRIKKIIAGNEQFTDFKDFSVLFDDDEWEIRRIVAKNPNSVKFDEYNQLIPSKVAINKINAAKDPNITKFGEYKKLISDNKKEVRIAVRSNPNLLSITDVFKTIYGLKPYLKKEYSSDLKIPQDFITNLVFSDDYYKWYFVSYNGEYIDNIIARKNLDEINNLSLRFNVDSNLIKLVGVKINHELQQIDNLKVEKNSLPNIYCSYALIKEIKIEYRKFKSLLFFYQYSSYFPYKELKIPKKKGGERMLKIPCKSLKSIQRWIKEEILEKAKPHECSRGFIKGESTFNNAEPHKAKELIIKMDIQDFFPSIKIWQIYRVFLSFGYTKEFSMILSLLCSVAEKKGDKTYRILPQGAPTSPILSNIVFYEADMEINGYCKKFGINYTRYADDLTFSSNNSELNISLFIHNIIRIVRSHHFFINQKKTKVLRRYQPQRVTGLIVNEEVHIPRDFVNRIRGILHKSEKYGYTSNEEMIKMNQKVHGMISYMNSIQPKKANKLKVWYDRINWN